MAASADSATVLDVGEALHQLESLTPSKHREFSL